MPNPPRTPSENGRAGSSREGRDYRETRGEQKNSSEGDEPLLPALDSLPSMRSQGSLPALSSLHSLSSLEPSIEEAVKMSAQRATKNKNYRRCVFDLARQIKGFPSIADAPARDLMKWVVLWYGQAEVAADKDVCEVIADFVEGWKRVKYPSGQGPLNKVLKLTEKLTPPPLPEFCTNLKIIRLATFCREMSRTAADGVFFLSCRSAGSLFDVEHTTALKWLHFLCEVGTVELVVRGGPDTMKAHRYRYVGK